MIWPGKHLSVISVRSVVKIGLFVAIILPLLLVSCADRSERPWDDRVVIPPVDPPPPPALILMQVPDFKLYVPDEKRTYILRRVGDDSVVTIFVEGEPERLATLREQEFLHARLKLDWTAQKHDRKLEYHYKLLEREKKRSATLLDQEIADKKEVLRMNDERKDLVDMRIRALEEEKVRPEESDALRKQSETLEREIGYTRAQIAVLEYKRWLRDVDERKATTPYAIETFNINAYMRRHVIKSENEVIARIKRQVAPASWLAWYAELYMKQGHLIVRNTPEVIAQVREYLKS